jgi:hypothetical protein
MALRAPYPLSNAREKRAEKHAGDGEKVQLEEALVFARVEEHNGAG